MPVTDPSRVASSEEIAHLRRALRAHRGAGLWSVAATLATVAGLMSLALGGGVAALWGPPLGAVLAILVLASLPLFLAWYMRTRARTARASAQTALDEAWLFAAQSLLARHGKDLSTQELGRLLGAGSEDSQRWLARLGASDRVASRIDDAGDIVYRVRTSLELAPEETTLDDAVQSFAGSSERQRSS